MASIVNLEGIVDINEEQWSGTWHFAKEKRLSLTFSYKRKDNLVPRDIFNYVSFIEDNKNINNNNDTTLDTIIGENTTITKPEIEIDVTKNKEPITIPVSHPLLGVWEGFFNIKNGKGSFTFMSIIYSIISLLNCR